MDILAAPPFLTASLLWQPRAGAFMLTVICKVTFILLPGTSVLAREPDPPNETDDHWNDEESRSLHTASDRVPFKRRADVVLVGHAYAPRGQPVSSLVARLLVGSVDKVIEVHANRIWTQEGELREGARFVKMPLLWERAAGGPHTSNPVGMRADARPDRYGQVAVPNLQPPGLHVSQPGDAITPVGLGPIAPRWPTRREKLYRHAGSWEHRRWAEQPLPEDIDAAFFNVAPPDQQVDEIRSDERIVLENLHAEHARLVTNLPGLSPRAVVERAGAGAQAVRLRCDTLSIDTDRGVCSLVWRGQVPLARADERGRVVISAESVSGEDAVKTVVGGLKVGAALPFGEAPTGAGARVEEGEEDVGQATMPLLVKATGVVLPFREGMSPLAMSEGASALRGREDDGTGTIPAGLARVKEVLPFGGARRAAPDPPAPPVVAPPVVLVPVQASSPSMVVVRAVEPAVRVQPEVVASKEVPAPPPMIGPLARGEVKETEEAPKAEEPAAAPKVTVAEKPAEKPALPLAEFPIERCAALAASMARRREDRAKILEENELTAEQWERLSGHWVEEIRKETKRGKAELLAAYDKAYVGRLEEERGPITVEEYARLVVAAERGSTEEVLAELTLPRGAMMRIQRVWVEWLVGDTTIDMEVRKSIETARMF